MADISPTPSSTGGSHTGRNIAIGIGITAGIITLVVVLSKKASASTPKMVNGQIPSGYYLGNDGKLHPLANSFGTTAGTGLTGSTGSNPLSALGNLISSLFKPSTGSSKPAGGTGITVGGGSGGGGGTKPTGTKPSGSNTQPAGQQGQTGSQSTTGTGPIWDPNVALPTFGQYTNYGSVIGYDDQGMPVFQYNDNYSQELFDQQAQQWENLASQGYDQQFLQDQAYNLGFLDDIWSGSDVNWSVYNDYAEDPRFDT